MAFIVGKHRTFYQHFAKIHQYTRAYAQALPKVGGVAPVAQSKVPDDTMSAPSFLAAAGVEAAKQVFRCFYVSIWLCVYFCMSVSRCIHRCVYVSVWLCVYFCMLVWKLPSKCIYRCVYKYGCVRVYLSTHQFFFG